jgi:DNA-binding PadR family transcriptional regulator
MNRSPTDLLPLSPAVMHILLALAAGERHGYAIMREVDELSAGAMRLAAGTLYRSIKKMLEDGLIETSDERPDPELDDERRRYYRLTPFGLQVLSAEAQRLGRLVDAAQRRTNQPVFTAKLGDVS